ncbi:MAG TPA: EH signature domain-containing protein [Methylomirabilota bacterium]|nr:EH signature domain-containing protein [Methylomirabilota bacterium]
MQNDQQTPENINKLLEGFETLRETTSSKVWSAGLLGSRLFSGPSRLESLAHQFAKEEEKPSPSKPPPIDPEEARKQWQHYLKTRDASQIERRALRYLCWDTEVAATPTFLRLIAQPDRPPSAPMILGLLGVHHALWSTPNDTLERLIVKWLRGYEGYNPVVRHLVAIADEVVGRDAAWRASRTAFEKRLTSRQLLEERGLTLQSAYAFTVAAELLKANVQILERAGDLHRAHYICDQLIPTDRDLLKPDTFADAVKRLVTIAVRATDVQFQDVVKGFVLLEPRLGDPRRHAARWENAGLAREAEIVKGWLAKEDLEFFFNLIMEGQEDRHHRRNFWLRYVQKAKDFRVAIGEADHQRLRMKLNDLRKRGRDYASLDDWEASAFIMDFGSVIVVEFSKAGNACSIHDAKSSREKLGDFQINKFYKTRLKKRPRSLGWFRHDQEGKWMWDIQQYLARFGIRE